MASVTVSLVDVRQRWRLANRGQLPKGRKTLEELARRDVGVLLAIGVELHRQLTAAQAKLEALESPAERTEVSPT